jgi:hypothetical protein
MFNYLEIIIGNYTVNEIYLDQKNKYSTTELCVSPTHQAYLLSNLLITDSTDLSNKKSYVTTKSDIYTNLIKITLF